MVHLLGEVQLTTRSWTSLVYTQSRNEPTKYTKFLAEIVKNSFHFFKNWLPNQYTARTNANIETIAPAQLLFEQFPPIVHKTHKAFPLGVTVINA